MSSTYPGRVDGVRLELLHDFEEGVVDFAVLLKLALHLHRK